MKIPLKLPIVALIAVLCILAAGAGFYFLRVPLHISLPKFPSTGIEGASPANAPPANAAFQLVDKSIFKESEKSSILIRPRFIDYTTSLIVYVSNGDTPETWTYEPETIGSGYFLFSDYFSFGSPVGKYLIVEYKNDKQTFSCYGISKEECITSPHFVNQFSIQIVPDSTVIKPSPPASVPVLPPSSTPPNTVGDANSILGQPIIAIFSTPSPRVMTDTANSATYSYTVWNVGGSHTQRLTDVQVTDDKCSPIVFLAGDINNDGKLNEGENWEYSCTTTLSETTTNTATAVGYDDDAGRETAIASTITTVVVVPEQGLEGTTPSASTENYSDAAPPTVPATPSDVVPPIDTTPPPNTTLLPDTGEPLGDAGFYSDTGLLRPFIHLEKSANHLNALIFEGRKTTYTYTVMNHGVVPVHDIVVTDNVCTPITYVSGDTNGNNLLGPTETWIYTCTTTHSGSTRSVATVVSRANGFTPMDVVITNPGLTSTGVAILSIFGIETIIVLAWFGVVQVHRRIKPRKHKHKRKRNG